MNKFSTPTKKDFLNFLNKFNEFLSNKLAFLTKKNFKQAFKNLIYDRRFIITILIIYYLYLLTYLLQHFIKINGF